MTNNEIKALVKNKDMSFVNFDLLFTMMENPGSNEKPYPFMQITSKQFIELLDNKRFLLLFMPNQELFYQIYENFSIELIQKLIDIEKEYVAKDQGDNAFKVSFISLSFSRVGCLIGVTGIFSELRNYVLYGKKKLAEEIFMTFYDYFASDLEKIQFGVDRPIGQRFIDFYKFYVTEKMSDELKLFLEMK